MPASLKDLLATAEHDASALLWSLAILTASALLGALIAHLLVRALRSWSRRTDTPADDQAVRHLHRPLRWLLPLSLLRIALPVSALAEPLAGPLAHALSIAVIIGVGWGLSAFVRVVEAAVKVRFDISSPDNLRARAIHTQARALRNVARFAIGLVTVAAVLTTFEQVRELGVSLLASAGVAGIVIGVAAQRSIGTIVAGVQIAITQPIRVDDVVIVEGEWGTIEEIALTYVVVRIWDLRRLVLPITYFIERPFQNWTRVSADLLGTVFLYTDYTVDVEGVRAELQRVLEDDARWDRKVWKLQVTNTSDRTVELRAMMSAADAGTLWDLRCHVRERLVGYLQRAQPGSLPLVRASLEGETGPSPAQPPPGAG